MNENRNRHIVTGVALMALLASLSWQGIASVAAIRGLP